MRVGTKSILFGAHQFIIHPIFVFIAWWKLYSFPFDPRLWIAFVVHDLGYWGKPNMDGPEGDRHVEFGANAMYNLFDYPVWAWERVKDKETGVLKLLRPRKWYDLCLYHSRFYAKKDNKPFSKLCVADKLSIVLEPAWLYLPRVRWSGEIDEYMKLAKSRTEAGEPKYASMKLSTSSQIQWFHDMQGYLGKWIEEHKDGKQDTWTPKIKEANTDSGVWK